jgi:hypothetical protein
VPATSGLVGRASGLAALVYHSMNVIRGVMFFKHEAYRNENEHRFQQLFRRGQAGAECEIQTAPYFVGALSRI